MTTAAGIGDCTVTATSGAVSAASTITATSATLKSISLSPTNPSVSTGGSLQLVATGSFSDGSSQNLTNSLTYGSSNSSIASISSSGLLQGNSAGSATITASSASVQVNLAVIVTSAALQTITVGQGSLSIAAGLSASLTATGSYSDGSSQDLSTTVTWGSSAPLTAAVDASGNVTALAAGGATITATLGIISGSDTVTVTAATVVGLTVNPPSITLAAGQSQAFTATATLTDGTTTDVTGSVHWNVNNPLLATISNSTGSNGIMSALSAGTTSVSASLGSISQSSTLYVNAATLTSVTISPGALSLPIGVSATLSATGLFSDGSSQDITSLVQWSSSSGSVSVSAAGLVLGLATGSATVTASMSGQSSAVSIAVSAAVLDAITISPISASLAAGLSQQLAATGTYCDGSTQDITFLVHWTSSNTSVLTMGSTGLLVAVGDGSATVTSSLGTVSQMSSVSVSAAVLQSIAVTAAQTSFSLGFTLQLNATGNYSDGTSRDLTATATWTTLSPAIATISGAGLASGVSVGSTEAMASFQGVVGSTSLAVNSATLTSISISPATVTLAQLFLTQQFTVTGHFSDGSSRTLSSGVYWTSTNALFATINTNGLMLSVGVGSLNVNASYGGFSTSATVNIF